MISVDKICAENIAYDNTNNDLTTYESQKEFRLISTDGQMMKLDV